MSVIGGHTLGLMGEHRLRPEPTMSRETRDRLILSLRSQGLSTTKIAHRVGITRPGVEAALRRLRNEQDDDWAEWE